MRKSQAIALRKQGKTYREIADALNTSRGVAWGLVNQERYTGKGGKKTKLSPENMKPVWKTIPAEKIHLFILRASKVLYVQEGFEVQNTADYLLSWIYTRTPEQLKPLNKSDRYFQGAMIKQGRRYITNLKEGNYSLFREREYIDNIKHTKQKRYNSSPGKALEEA